MFISNEPSINFSPRGNNKIKYLIIHYTNTQTISEALQILQGKKGKDLELSAHYLIDERGNVMWLVDEGMQSWHAKKSYWDGDDDLDKFSIGIELQNPGHKYGYKEFPEDQIRSLIKLCKNIADRNRILPYYLLGHADVNPDETDPGEYFPWEKLAKDDLGLWYDVKDSDIIRAYENIQYEDKVKELFVEYGYNPSCDLKQIITAFQRHYEHEVFIKAPDQIGKANISNLSRLSSLLRQKDAMKPLSI